MEVAVFYIPPYNQSKVLKYASLLPCVSQTDWLWNMPNNIITDLSHSRYKFAGTVKSRTEALQAHI